MAASALPAAEWNWFEQYLKLRAKGLRRAAMEALHSFIAAARGWDFETRKMFVIWVSDHATDFADQRLLIPHNLLTDVMAPTIREWLLREPESSLACYLSGKYCHGGDADPLPLDAFRQSMVLDPSFQPARRAFIDWVIAHAEYHQHELPYYGYLGPVDKDVRHLTEALQMLPDVDHPLWRETIGSELAELLETATLWQRFQQSGDRDFAEWCEANGVLARFASAE